MPESVTLTVGGRTMVIETGELAKQANGSALVRYGDQNVVLCAVTASEKPREGIDFFPLTCDFEEKMYAAGKIPGGYIKREGRPSEHAVISSRQIDRPIRPLFPDGFRNDIQIVATVLSVDPELDADVLGVCAAGAALALSDIPFDKTVAAVRVGRDERRQLHLQSNASAVRNRRHGHRDRRDGRRRHDGRGRGQGDRRGRLPGRRRVRARRDSQDRQGDRPAREKSRKGQARVSRGKARSGARQVGAQGVRQGRCCRDARRR